MKNFLIIIIVSAFLLLAHVFALLTSAYWSIWWYDNIMHITGGLWAGALGLLFFNEINESKEFKWFSVFVITASFAAFVGVLWELFEYSFDRLTGYRNMFGIAQQGLSDTMSDLFFDLTGGFAAAIVKKFKKLF